MDTEEATSSGLGMNSTDETLITCYRCLHPARDDELVRSAYSTIVSPSDSVLDSAPVHKIPREILGSIFAYAIAADRCITRAYRNKQMHPLLAFRATCKYWYHLTVSNKSLWSHIDVYLPRCYINTSRLHIAYSTRLWLRYSKGSPLHLHFVCSYGEVVALMSDSLETLQTHAPCISAVTFSDRCPEEIVRDVLQLCSSHAKPGTLKHLAVAEVTALKNAEAGYNHLKWPTSLLYGLTSLQIGNLDDAIGLSMSLLWDVLVNSPHMCALQLQGQHIVSFDQSKNPFVPAITLHSLHVLELENIHRSELLQLLQTVDTGKSRLHFGLSIENHDSTVLAAAKAFMKRSQLVSLGLGKDATDLAKDLSDAPELHTLHFDFNKRHREKIDLSIDLTTGAPRWPTIRCLHLANGGIREEADREMIKNLVNAYNLNEIHFVGFSVPSGSRYAHWGPSNRNQEK